MDWNQKGSVLWDWEILPPVDANATENPQNVMQAQLKFVEFASTVGHESAHSSGGTFSSSSEMGYGSSKSSMSASIDSSSKAGNNMEFRFAAVKDPDRNTSRKTELGKIDDTGSSPSSAVPVSNGEPVIGLRLGKRTYFEDVCGGQNAKSSPSSANATNPSHASAKKAKVDQQKPHNSYCQVEGCKVDLSSAKDYHRKHRVCLNHSKAPKVVVARLERRFCQQCSRFHGLAEFDQKKRSCRRRLNDHNARRRKPQPEAISFSLSRLSTVFYGARQHTSILFDQDPYDQMRNSASSSWYNPGSFKFTEAKAPWLKPTRSVGTDGMHLSSQQMSNNIVAHGAHHEFDGLMAFKGTSLKVLNQGAVASNSSGASDLQRAHTLLSSNSAGAVANLQPGPQVHPGVTAIAGTSNPSILRGTGSSPGFWQDGQPLNNHVPFQAFDRLGSDNVKVHEQLQLLKLKPPYDNSSHFELMH